ncbi:MAG: protein kinase domain-containing protein [Chthoniobacterales bacterium]
MPISTRDKTPACEQCGAPLLNLAVAGSCLNCLLSTGIEDGLEHFRVSSNEPPGRVYQHYEILGHPDGSIWELGRGPTGVTYKARDINLDTPVALKVIDTLFWADPAARRRFLHEVQAAAQLHHPNVAGVFHIGMINSASGAQALANAEDSQGGDCFYAMEFVEGESIEQRLRRTGPLKAALVLEIALQVARALAAAEKRGLFHRDLRPSNIMLADQEENDPLGNNERVWVKVIDFGLARLATGEKDSSVNVSLLGAPAFSGPEERTVSRIDGRSDIYSLGATLWYSLTGNIPGERSPKTPLPLNQLARHDVPSPVIALLKSMLAIEPEHRPDSAAELTEALQQCLDTLSDAARLSRGRTRRWAVGAVASLAAALVGVAIYFAPSSAPEDKSIAVLPFRNLGNDPANAFFAEGVQDDILSRLVKIRDLKVINHLGTSRYPADAPRDLGAIARTLGVRHLLQGGLRLAGDRVVLHVSLIDARDGQELWSASYDRKLVDAINLQGELASNIADALDAKLSPRERGEVRARPTRNPDAYVLYLRGRKLERNPAFSITGFEGAETLYRQAVALDPGFALAHARLAITLGLLHRFRGPTEELEAGARAEAREALRLEPELGEAHLAQGLYQYRIERDFNRALPELEIARRLLPNDSEVEETIAFIYRRLGEWRQARVDQERALAGDPLNFEYERELNATACLLRDWHPAAKHAAQASTLAPKLDTLRGEWALVALWQSGNLAPLREFFHDLSGFGDPEGNLAWARWDAAMLARNFADARKAIDYFPLATLPSVMGAPVPKAYLKGCAWLAQGENARAQELFEIARPSMEAETLAHPNDAMRHARLGLLYAYMGRKTDAIREGERAARLMPVSQDAIDGHEWRCNLALIHARVGDTDVALSMVESLLQQPGCVSPNNEACLTLWDLRLRWQWDPLRKDAVFQRILAGPEPATIF